MICIQSLVEILPSCSGEEIEMEKSTDEQKERIDGQSETITC